MANSSLWFVLAAMLLGCGGASRAQALAPASDASIAGGSAAIAATMRGPNRSHGAADRDRYRHPVETLAFFGLTPTMTVLDVGPGGRRRGGYYTELLAPVLVKDGLYLATNTGPASTAPAPSTHHWTAYEGARFDDLLRAAPELFGKAWVIAQVESVGLRLAARSEINANPRDTRDHPQGVWTLPPELALGDVDRNKYLAIGESGRMTLKFVRVADGAAR